MTARRGRANCGGRAAIPSHDDSDIELTRLSDVRKIECWFSQFTVSLCRACHEGSKRIIEHRSYGRADRREEGQHACRLSGDWWKEDTSKNNFDSIINEHSICYFLDKALHREPRYDMRC